MKIAELRKQREAKRATFLSLLANTANISLSTRRAGLRMSSVYLRRHTDPEFARAWDRALEEGRKALASGQAPDTALPGCGKFTVGRATGGAPILRDARWDLWNPDKERRFFEALAATNNIGFAARCADINKESINARSRQWPAFAKAVADTRRQAEASLERQMAEAGSPTLVPPTVPFEVETRIESIDKAIKMVQIILPELRDRPPIKHRKGTFAGKRPKPGPLIDRLADALARASMASARNREDSA